MLDGWSCFSNFQHINESDEPPVPLKQPHLPFSPETSKAFRADNTKSKQINKQRAPGRSLWTGRQYPEGADWQVAAVGVKKGGMLVIDVLSGLGWLSEQQSWTVITLTDMRAALCGAVRILALAYTPVFWSLSSLNELGGAPNGTSLSRS